LDELQAARVRKRLAQLALISIAASPVGGITLHDVIRDFVRAELGGKQLAELHRKLVKRPRRACLRQTLRVVRAGDGG
jgi:hypothetical protein